MALPKLIVVLGPTACGKSGLGVELAKSVGGEIVSADSRQVYRGLDLGTGKITAEEMDGVPHHLLDIVEPNESYSVAQFQPDAYAAIDGILAREKVPLLVGGTGLYLDAIVSGRDFAAGAAGGAVREALQRQLEREGIEPLLAELRQVDPAAAERLHPSDTKRILRALEVWRETGETITEHNQRTGSLPRKYDAVYIGLRFADREEMKALIDARVDEMVERGLLQEVEALLARGVPRDATALQAIGYKEFLRYEEGGCTLEEAVAEVKLRSRQYAKRQLTWLRRNGAIHWIVWDKGRDFDKALQEATEILAARG